jgi:valyl-tRNA synthetase
VFRQTLCMSAATLKDAGNALFTAGDVPGAISKYDEALKLTTGASDSAAAGEDSRTLVASLHNNLAACWLRLEDPARALEHADAALTFEPSLVKVRAAFSCCAGATVSN